MIHQHLHVLQLCFSGTDPVAFLVFDRQFSNRWIRHDQIIFLIRRHFSFRRALSGFIDAVGFQRIIPMDSLHAAAMIKLQHPGNLPLIFLFLTSV